MKALVKTQRGKDSSTEQIIKHKAPLVQWEWLFEACENLNALKALIVPD